MNVAIVIPTYKRIKKLTRCINSIYKSTHSNWKITVVCDNNDLESAKFISDLEDPKIEAIVQPEHRFVIGAWNRFAYDYRNDFSWDAMMWCCDDVEFYQHALQQAVTCHEKNFPDNDGVVGFKQVCHGHNDYQFKWFGQSLLGRAWIERYADADYQICCPDYKHFYQDEEMWKYANSLGKFVNCPTAILQHYHPDKCKEEMDESHAIPRQYKSQDQATYNVRTNLGLVWGQTWEKIRK